MIHFDLETASLKEDAAIIQIAAIADDGEEFEVKIKFKIEDASKEALEINSYDKDVWEKEAIHPRRAAQLFAAFIRKHADRTRISKRTGKSFPTTRGSAWNGARFDGPRIQHWFKRLNEFCPLDFMIFDPMQLAMWVFPDEDKYQLQTIAEKLGCKLEGAHDALIDVRMMIKTTEALRAKLL